MHSLLETVTSLTSDNFVDLSHTFYAGIPHASDMPDESTRVLYDFEPDGFRAHLYGFAGQWGTHIDPPVHFVQDGRSLEHIAPHKLILPLVVIDCAQEASRDPDYLMPPSKLTEHEIQHGLIPPNSFVVMKTGWSSRWPDPRDMKNSDSNGTAHFPGWTVDAARFLIDERNVSAFGHETTDTDGGINVSNDNFECEKYILQSDRYQIEMLSSLDRIPPAGAIVFVGFPKPRGGSGFPARVIALIPDG